MSMTSNAVLPTAAVPPWFSAERGIMADVVGTQGDAVMVDLADVGPLSKEGAAVTPPCQRREHPWRPGPGTFVAQVGGRGMGADDQAEQFRDVATIVGNL